MDTSRPVIDEKAIKRRSLKRNLKRGTAIYIMLIPAIIWYLLFFYKPIGALQVAVKDYNPIKGIAGSKWVGFKHFERFFASPYLGRIVKNSFL